MSKKPRPSKGGKVAKGDLIVRDPETQKFINWLAAGLKKPGRSLSGLARALGKAPPQARKLLDGRRRMLATELSIISSYIGEPVPFVGIADLTTRAEVVCAVGDGIWYESSLFNGTVLYQDNQAVPIVPDSTYAGMIQYAAKVNDSSMDRVLEKGCYAIFVAYRDARPKPVNGDVVVCEIRRSGLFKPAILRLIDTAKGWELQSYSHAEKNGRTSTVMRLDKDMTHGRDPGDEEVDIRGLVIAKYASLGALLSSQII